MKYHVVDKLRKMLTWLSSIWRLFAVNDLCRRLCHGCCQDEETGFTTATTCGSDSDCQGKNFHCFMNRCLCNAGFFFNPSDQSCSPTCSTSDLVNKFVEYPESVLHGYYLHVRDGLILQDCVDLCLNTSSCLAFSFRAEGGRCLPHEATALKDTSLWCPTSSEGWSHFQRACLGQKSTEHKAQRQRESCGDWQTTGGKSGVYSIQLAENREQLRVWCDMDSGDGGWLVFQRRVDGSVDFYRNWTQYVNGFGNVTGEFWLGLSKLYTLTKKRHHQLRVDLREKNGEHHYAEYSSFRVDGPETNYRLAVSGYSGNAGDSMNTHNSRSFSTHDRDNDVVSSNCALLLNGGWWYNACHTSNLNGRYKGDGATSADGINWYLAHSDYRSYTFSEMKVKPV